LICVTTSFENRLQLVRIVVRENNILWIERTLGPAVDILHKPGIIRERSDGNVTLDAAEL